MCAKPWQRWRTDGNIFTVSGCTPVGAQQQQPMNIDASRQHSFCLGLSTLTCHGLIACRSVCLPCHAMLSLLWPSFLTENCIAQRSPIVRPKPIPGTPVILARLSYARDLCCLPPFFFSFVSCSLCRLAIRLHFLKPFDPLSHMIILFRLLHLVYEI